MNDLSDSIVARDALLDDPTFERIASSARKLAGLQIVSSKRSLVQSRLARRLRELDLATFQSYLDLLDSPAGQGEREQFVSALTTNVTQFFREPHHFDRLEQDVLPGLIDRARKGGRVRIWSAGCSSGQEAFTIAALATKLEPNLADMDFRILGTDIDNAILARATTARFATPALSQLAPDKKQMLFSDAGNDGSYTIRPELRSIVAFRHLNLIGPWPMQGQFDAVFCRNVVIYFDEDTQNALWPRFVSSMTNGAPLFLGHSERIVDPASFGLKPDGLTTYKKVAGDAVRQKNTTNEEGRNGLA